MEHNEEAVLVQASISQELEARALDAEGQQLDSSQTHNVSINTRDVGFERKRRRLGGGGTVCERQR